MTSIIMLVSNTDYPPAHYTGSAIGTIKFFTTLPYELIVVDNNSTVTLGGLKWEETVDKYIKNDQNLGVAKGWNQGLAVAEGEHIAILNNDIQVYEHWLDDLIEGLQHVSVCQATPMYDLPYGRAQEARDRRQEWLTKTPDQYLRDFRDFSCTVTTRKLMDEIGPFDENYGIGYGEDIDFYFRCEQAGKTVKSNKRVNIHHVGSATAHTLGYQGLKVGEIMNRNKEYTQQKWQLDQNGEPKFRIDRRNAHAQI